MLRSDNIPEATIKTPDRYFAAERASEGRREPPRWATEFVWAGRVFAQGRGVARWGPPWATGRGQGVRGYHRGRDRGPEWRFWAFGAKPGRQP